MFLGRIFSQKLQTVPFDAVIHLKFSEKRAAISHKVFVITISLSLASCALSEQENAEDTHPQKPNLVFVLTDEQRYDTSAPYGNSKPEIL